MANKSFVIQYLIKARNEFSEAADKTRVSARKMREEIIKAKKDFKAASASMQKAKFTLPSIMVGRVSLKKMRAEAAKLRVAFKKTLSSLSVPGVISPVLRGTRDLLKKIQTEALKTKRTFKRAFASMRAEISKTVKSFDRIKNATAGLRRAGVVMTAAITAPIILAGVSLKNAARDAQETRSKFATVFKSMATESQTGAAALAQNFGLAETKAQELLANTGDLLTGFGFTTKSALRLSLEVNKLAVDLASFTNSSGGAEGASAALTKALLGERESLKTLGIAILEKDVLAKVGQLVTEGRTFGSLRQAKAEATLAIAIEQSKNAIGDFARTQQDLANQERITSSRIQDLKESFGRALLPIALKMTQAFRGVVESLTALNPETKKTILIIAGLAAVVGPLLLAVGSMVLIWPALTVGATIFATAATAALGPLLPLIAAVALGAALIIANWDKVQAFFSGFSDGLQASLGPALSALVADFTEAAAVISSLFGKDSEASKSLDSFSNVGQLMGEIVGGALTTLINGLSGVGELLGQIIAATVSFDFSNFDPEAIKAQFLGEPAQPVRAESNVNVGVQVGLDEGLRQTAPAVIEGAGTRRADVGAN